MKNISKIIVSALSFGLIAVVPAFAFAAVVPSVSGGVSAGVRVGSSTREVDASIHAAAIAHASTTKAQNVQTRINNGITRSDTEITNRISALNALSARIQAMLKVSADEKTGFAAEVQTEIADLTTLKAQIDSDTSTTTLTTDSKSITQAYRIYALILPQAEIVAAADRVETIVSMMTTIGTKFQTRITEAQTAGKNVTALNTSLTDYNAKIADANTQAAAANTEVALLKPDNGDTTIAASNKAALVDARSKIKVAASDLKTARSDAQTILNGLKALEVKSTVTASSTTSV